MPHGLTTQYRLFSLPPVTITTAFRQLKRLPKQPKEAFSFKYGGVVQTIQAIPFVDLV